MAATVNILEGSTFVVSDRCGDIDGTPVEPHGFFADDTRFLSRFVMTINGERPTSLSVDETNYYAAQFFVAPGVASTYLNSPLAAFRRRVVLQGFHEWITLFNHGTERVALDIEIEIDADFADLFEVKDATTAQKRGEHYRRLERERLVLGYQRETFVRETWISVVDTDHELYEHGVRFHVELDPQDRWTGEIDVTPVSDVHDPGEPLTAADWEDPTVRLGLRAWNTQVPELTCTWDPLDDIYRMSLRDLAALRIERRVRPGKELPAAGLPWFMSLFGRDSILTSFQALPFVPELAEAALLVLGDFQARTMDDFRDAEPGKILHEVRYGELTAFEERPHSPYYGSADSTPLYLVLLDEFDRWTGRHDLVRELEPVARNALAWIDEHGDRDGDGYVEYETRNPTTGLPNQCWKDSPTSIQWADGTLASLPRATCEIQGYVYDAKRRTARIAREIWDDTALADRLEEQAADLKARFNRDFWLDDLGHFAVALDGEKRAVDSLTSNIGHLLWSGIVDDEHVPAVVACLLDDRLFTGWGVRTFATGQTGYNPIGYHLGTVWPHDTAIAAEGLRRYGFPAEATRLAMALLEAAELFDRRLPEAFAGFPRDLTRFPVVYPTACSPQAWASGTPLMLVRTMLGLDPDGAILRSSPLLPETIRGLRVRRIPGRWGRADAGVDAGDAVVLALDDAKNAGARDIAEVFRSFADHVDPSSTHGVHLSLRFDLRDSGSWRIAIDDGRVIVNQSPEPADCVFTTDEATLLAVLAGRQNANTAVLSGKVHVEGDLGIALKIQHFMASGLRGDLV